MLGLALLPACADIMEPQETFDDAPDAEAPPTQATLPAVPASAAALKLAEQADAYNDSMMAWHLFRLLPVAERPVHGQELLESGLALNPYNFLLADAGVEAANTPEARSRFETSFAATLDSVTRTDCPKTGLYPETVYGRLKKNSVK